MQGKSVDTSQERYQLNWPGKAEAYRSIQTPSAETLVPNFSTAIDWDSAENIMIEGENLTVLKLLQHAYHGKVKFILIDPPYNTGSDSFVYPDKFAESKNDYLKRSGDKDEKGFMLKEELFRANRKDNGYFHSNWLSMMLPRLFLASNLLKEEGAILVHIDEHEQANLTLLLNEIFGEDNFLGHIVWDKGNPKGDAGGIAYQHESILVYAKNKEKLLAGNELTRKKRNAERILKKASELFKLLGKEEIPGELKKYDLPGPALHTLKRKYTIDEINSQFKSWLKKQDFTGGELAYNNIDEQGSVFRLVSMAWPNKKKAPDDYFIPIEHPITKKACPVPHRGWRFPSNTIQQLLNNGEIIFGADESVQPQRKYLLSENMYENIPSILFYGGSDDDLLRKMELEFENPKPLEFTKSLVQAFTKANTKDIVLDFFAGSGTTAHAVIEANKQDEGNRRFICVQLPELIDEQSPMYQKGYRTIAELTIKRISSATMENPGTGLRCFTLTSSNFKTWRGDIIENEAGLIAQLKQFSNSIKDGAIAIEILWELLIKNGIPLTEKIKTISKETGEIIFTTENGKIAFCLDSFNEAVQKNVLQLKPATLFCLDTFFDKEDCQKTNAQVKFQLNTILNLKQYSHQP